MSPHDLIVCGIAPLRAAQFAMPLTAAMDRFDISTPQRQAAFIGQCAHESSGFSSLSESTYYSDPERIPKVFGSRAGPDYASLARNPEALANRVYANRYGNGDEASGDGYRFRGAGLIQLTFRDNFASCAADLGRDFAGFAEWVRTPEGACQSAAWYWRVHDLNALADVWNIDGITKVINPALLGASQRRDACRVALNALSA